MENPQVILKKIKEAYKSYYLSAFHVSSEYEYIENMQSELFADENSKITKEPMRTGRRNCSANCSANYQ